MSHVRYTAILKANASDKAIRQAAQGLVEHEYSYESNCMFDEVVSCYGIRRHRGVWTTESATNDYSKTCYDLNVYPVYTIPEKKRESILRKANENASKIAARMDAYVAKHGLRTLKAKYLTCQNCGSKINREVLVSYYGRETHSHVCPVCHRANLGSEAYNNHMAELERKLREWQNFPAREEERIQKENRPNALFLVFDIHE